MVKATRAEKFKANRGIQEHIIELLQTSPDGPKTRGQLFEECIGTFPLADLKTVGNALSILKRKKKVVRLPSSKDRRGYRWDVIRAPAVQSYLPQSEFVTPGDVLTPAAVGEVIITAIGNMKKRIREQNEKIDQLLNTLSNRKNAWGATEKDLRDKIMEKNKIIESLTAQLTPPPGMTFKLEEIANFTGERDGQT